MLVNEKYVHGGGKLNRNVTDMSVNINPCGTPENVISAIQSAAGDVCMYPDACCTELVTGIGKMFDLPSDYIICGNGADELIYNFAATLGAGSCALIYAPAFAEYERALRACNVNVKYHITDFRMSMSDIFKNEIASADAVFSCMPSNPAGQLIDRNVLETLLEMCQESSTKCFLDICFYELTEKFDAIYISQLVKKFSCLCVLSAFTKTYAIPGVRLGFMLCTDTSVIEAVSRRQQCWNVSLIAQRAGLACLECGDYVEKSRSFIVAERKYLYENLSKHVEKVFQSDANYILFYEPKLDAEKLVAAGVKIRDCSDYTGLGSGYFRVCVGSHETNEKFLKKLLEQMFDL